MNFYKWISMLISFSAPLSTLIACDVCGCGINGFQGGILPRFNQPIIGINYTYASFRHADVAESTFGDYKILSDKSYRLNVMARYMPNERLQILVDIPIIGQSRMDSGGKSTLIGMGDIGVQAHYKLTSPQKQLGKQWQHVYFIGWGVRVPNGKYQQRDRFGQILPIGIQVGTGAWSHSILSNWIINHGKWGLHLESNLNYYMTNEFQYQKGKHFLQGIYLFKSIQAGKTFLVPTIGMQVEHYGQDSEYKQMIHHTGGTFLNGLLRLDWQSNRFNFGVFSAIGVLQKRPSTQPLRRPSIGITSIYFFS